MDLVTCEAKLEDLTNKRAALVNEAQELVQAGKVKKSLDREKWDALDDQIVLYDADIKTHERQLDTLKRETAPPVNADGLPANIKPHEVTKSDYNHAVFTRWAKQGANGITSEEASAYIEHDNNIGAVFKLNALTPDGAGSDTSAEAAIPTTTEARVIQTLRQFGGMRPMAAQMSISTGEKRIVPQYDGKNEKGARIDRTAARSATNPSQTDADLKDYTGIECTPYEYTSKVIPVAHKTLNDVRFNLEGDVMKQAMRRIGRVQNCLLYTSPSPRDS